MIETILKHCGDLNGQKWSFGQQQDSHEFLLAILDVLSKETSSKESIQGSILDQNYNRWVGFTDIVFKDLFFIPKNLKYA